MRLLFVFDPLRRAVILVGGDKAGNWRRWCGASVRAAEAAYADYLHGIEEGNAR